MAKARGVLFHHFWGDYSAGIQLVFCEDVDSPRPHEVARARSAVSALNAESEIASLSGSTRTNPVGGPLPTDRGWQVAEKCPAAITITVDSAGVDLVERQLRRHGLVFSPCGFRHCGDQCADQSIGGTPHSCDRGPPFEVEVDCLAHRQIPLFSEVA